VSDPNAPKDDEALGLTPTEDEEEPEWADQIRSLRRQRGPRVEERLGDEDADRERPVPDL
jgi:hypothetical protein